MSPNSIQKKPLRTIYERGATAFWACQYDQRFCYCLYVPSSYSEGGEKQFPLIVVVHGSGRVAESYRDRFRDFAEHHECIVMAPLFPCGVGNPDDQEGYKLLGYGGIRYDHVLLAMVDEVRAKYWTLGEKLLLFGYSGGGHFAHRFFYCHPQRLAAVSIGAPGAVTLLDELRPWWAGIGGMETKLGLHCDVEAMRSVPVQMVVGANDVETWEVIVKPDSPHWIPGVNDSGETRIERLQALCRSFEANGIAVRFDLVNGVAHNGFAVLDPVKAFFAETLARLRAMGSLAED
ncbi:MAG: alpha/beta hydrolase [Pyrinomonadaceae bacterium]|nr:alpha/beta hydrolase [Pyrinomonadaceae bacterium]